MSIFYTIAFIGFLMLVAYASLLNKKKNLQKPADPSAANKVDKAG